MFLLVSVRHVAAYPGGHQHGVSIQISINLDKTFLRIPRIRNIPLTWILARVFAYLPPFISQILDLSIERLWFLFWSILNGVTLKTSDRYCKAFPKKISIKAKIRFRTKTIATLLSRNNYSDRPKSNIITKFSLCVIHVLWWVLQ